jgi:hypothetical protein
VRFARPIPVLGHLTKERRFRNSAQVAPSGERNALDFYTDDLAIFDTTLRWFLGSFQFPMLKFNEKYFLDRKCLTACAYRRNRRWRWLVLAWDAH